MKYIKKFNEELKPDTYRKAGNRLNYYNKTKRATALLDYADEQEFGIYDIFMANSSVLVGTHGGNTFTKPTLIAIYAGKLSSERDLINFRNRDKRDQILTSLVQDWKNGDQALSLTFEFGFKPTMETITKTGLSHFKNPQRPAAETVRYIGCVPVFSIELEFSEWYEGIEEWDAESKWEMEHRGEEFTPSDIYQFFEGTRSFELTLKKPHSDYFGIFSNRRSAHKFKSWLLSILDNEIKDNILDLMSIVSGQGEDINLIMNKFKNISIHGLYDEEIKNSSNLQNKWYLKTI